MRRLKIGGCLWQHHEPVMFGKNHLDTSVSSACQINVDELWGTAQSEGWRPSSSPRSNWSPPPKETNGYLRVRCNGGLNQQRSAVGLILRALGFDNSTRIYSAAGKLFGGERFMHPFRSLFPRLENHSTVDATGELVESTSRLIGSAVDYMVCLLAGIFMPTYDGPGNFANNLLGHRSYYGFQTIIRPDRKELAPIFVDREKGKTAGFEESVRLVMRKMSFGGPHKRVSPESLYTNSWPECFCQNAPRDPADKCPPYNTMEVLDSQLENEAVNDPLNPTAS